MNNSDQQSRWLTDRRAALLFLGVWVALFAFHLLTLDKVPWVLIDEPWLAQASRSLAQEGEAVLPSFPLRYGGPWRVMFNMALQAPVIRVLGYNLFSIRLPSLLCFMLSLFFWYAAVRRMAGTRPGLCFVVLYSLQLPVFLAAHVARPESLTLLILAVSVWLVTLFDARPFLKVLLVGAVSPLAYRSQPAGLIVPFVMAFVGAWWLWRKGRLSVRLVLATLAAGAVLLLVYNHFFHMTGLLESLRRSEGAVFNRVSLDIPLAERLLAFPRRILGAVWKSAYRWRVVHLAVFCLIVAGGVFLGRRRREGDGVLAVAAVGLVSAWCFLCIAGRPSSFYFVHLYPWLTLLLVGAAPRLAERWKQARLVPVGLAVYGLLYLGLYVNLFRGVDFAGFADRLRRAVPEGSSVLGRTQYEIVLGEDRSYYAVPDLKGVGRPAMPLREYVETNGVEYILYDSWLRKAAGGKAGRQWLWFAELRVEEFLESFGGRTALIEDRYFGSRWFDYRIETSGPLLCYEFGREWPFVWRRVPPLPFVTECYRVRVGEDGGFPAPLAMPRSP